MTHIDLNAYCGKRRKPKHYSSEKASKEDGQISANQDKMKERK